MSQRIKIKEIKEITHDVNQFRVEKPAGYYFTPGQATELSIDQDGWRDKKRPFTFTSTPDEEDLEFVIKSYPDHSGVTEQLAKLKSGDYLMIDESWGAISYRGKGVFIAGGAGVTPFIGIFRQLEREGKAAGNSLIFANKTSKDVILEEYFKDLLGEDFLSILSEESKEHHENGIIDQDFLRSNIDDFSQEFYICGPDQMVKDISRQLEKLGANPDAITFEK